MSVFFAQKQPGCALCSVSSGVTQGSARQKEGRLQTGCKPALNRLQTGCSDPFLATPLFENGIDAFCRADS